MTALLAAFLAVWKIAAFCLVAYVVACAVVARADRRARERGGR
jgi:hypothetical protein